MLLRRPRKRPSRFRPWERRRRMPRGALLPAALLVLFGLWLIDPDTLKTAWIRFPTHSIEHVDPRLLSVVDGDTVRLAGATIRLTGFDAPETYRAQCDAELVQGEAATARLRQLINRATAAELAYLSRHDVYGRDLVRLTLDGRNVADTMVGDGFARRYGGGQRRPWC